MRVKVFEPGWIEPLLRFHKRDLKNKNIQSSTTCGEDLQNICKELSKVFAKVPFSQKGPQKQRYWEFLRFWPFWPSNWHWSLYLTRSTYYNLGVLEIFILIFFVKAVLQALFFCGFLGTGWPHKQTFWWGFSKLQYLPILFLLLWATRSLRGTKKFIPQEGNNSPNWDLYLTWRLSPQKKESRILSSSLFFLFWLEESFSLYRLVRMGLPPSSSSSSSSPISRERERDERQIRPISSHPPRQQRLGCSQNRLSQAIKEARSRFKARLCNLHSQIESEQSRSWNYAFLINSSL